MIIIQERMGRVIEFSCFCQSSLFSSRQKACQLEVRVQATSSQDFRCSICNMNDIITYTFPMQTSTVHIHKLTSWHMYISNGEFLTLHHHTRTTIQQLTRERVDLYERLSDRPVGFSGSNPPSRDTALSGRSNIKSPCPPHTSTPPTR